MFRRRRLCAPGGVLRHAAAARPPRLPEALLQPGRYAPVRGLASCNHLSVNNVSPARNILETAPNVVLHYISCLISGTCSSATPSRTTIDTSASPTPWSRYLQNINTLCRIHTISSQYLHNIYTISTHYLRPGPGGDTLQPGGRDPDGAGVGSLPGQRPRAARRQ